ncbi:MULTISPECIES: phosphatidylserine decarboxylase [Thalassospira]|uniref:Phosphatidylserine decarboxylase proenzyme n=1 Tax=Thalassospira xiamenensis TaxID=220697 RepID=A0A285RNH3_9PROT|nr:MULTISPECIES: phosphatidylserine decarboxylase [Thalassospira]WOI09410.1 phosphatidylserine decarboxylase [Thalassospira lucentensis]SOB95269.1 phosphatidylserine decarboxylase [Thalassospira xiamenensis]
MVVTRPTGNHCRNCYARTHGNQGIKTLKSVLVPINPEGWKFVAIFAAITVVLFLIAEPLGWIGVILTLWCAYFFRDPDRITPVDENLVISPADGRVCMISKAPLPKELELDDKTPRTRVSIFMNVFNVHVNRCPVNGEVVGEAYVPGKFVNAELDKASENNERQILLVRDKEGREFGVVQIAGLVARRILCDVGRGSQLKAGERFGLIRFGSRVDVYLPEGVEPKVIVGQTTIAGETILADIAAKGAEAAVGEIR